MPIDSAGNTLWTTGNAPYSGARALTADADLNAAQGQGRGVFIATTAAGNVRLRMMDGTFLVVPVAVGPTLFDNISVKGFTSSGTTATAVVSVLV